MVRLGHPARITQSLLTRTLDYRASRSEDAEIAKDVKDELEGNMRDLAKKKGDKGWVKGRERAKKWDDVRELRKEWVLWFGCAEIGALTGCALGIVSGREKSSRTSWLVRRYA